MNATREEAIETLRSFGLALLELCEQFDVESVTVHADTEGDRPWVSGSMFNASGEYPIASTGWFPEEDDIGDSDRQRVPVTHTAVDR